jgi:hypothetical protein
MTSRGLGIRRHEICAIQPWQPGLSIGIIKYTGLPEQKETLNISKKEVNSSATSFHVFCNFSLCGLCLGFEWLG